MLECRVFRLQRWESEALGLVSRESKPVLLLLPKETELIKDVLLTEAVMDFFTNLLILPDPG